MEAAQGDRRTSTTAGSMKDTTERKHGYLENYFQEIYIFSFTLKKS